MRKRLDGNAQQLPDLSTRIRGGSNLKAVEPIVINFILLFLKGFILIFLYLVGNPELVSEAKHVSVSLIV